MHSDQGSGFQRCRVQGAPNKGHGFRSINCPQGLPPCLASTRTFLYLLWVLMITVEDAKLMLWDSEIGKVLKGFFNVTEESNLLSSQFCLQAVHSDHSVKRQSTGQSFEQDELASGRSRCRHFHSATTLEPWFSYACTTQTTSRVRYPFPHPWVVLEATHSLHMLVCQWWTSHCSCLHTLISDKLLQSSARENNSVSPLGVYHGSILYFIPVTLMPLAIMVLFLYAMGNLRCLDEQTSGHLDQDDQFVTTHSFGQLTWQSSWWWGVFKCAHFPTLTWTYI